MNPDRGDPKPIPDLEPSGDRIISGITGYVSECLSDHLKDKSQLEDQITDIAQGNVTEKHRREIDLKGSLMRRLWTRYFTEEKPEIPPSHVVERLNYLTQEIANLRELSDALSRGERVDDGKRYIVESAHDLVDFIIQINRQLISSDTTAQEADAEELFAIYDTFDPVGAKELKYKMKIAIAPDTSS